MGQEQHQERLMENHVVKVSSPGPQNSELFLVVDFINRQVAVVAVDARTGNVRVTDVQTMTQRGL